MAAYLRRGLAADLLAGLFALLFGESALDRAVELEGAAGGQPDAELVGRMAQKVGLFFVTGLAGSFVGGLFALVFAHFRGHLVSESDWTRSLSLAAAIFTGAILIPFLKDPANPPTVGDPATIVGRTGAYLAMVALSLLTVLAAWDAARALRGRGVSAPVRHVAVGLVLAVSACWCSSPCYRTARTPAGSRPACCGTSGSPPWARCSSSGPGSMRSSEPSANELPGERSREGGAPETGGEGETGLRAPGRRSLRSSRPLSGTVLNPASRALSREAGGRRERATPSPAGPAGR
ncbi:hypothetical protein GBA63_18990 [Rubrobacter tropicus]|uniref:Uncharacterized protein n=1 Tax=Rubrobacter tropicus TaxID=2653851 RepID=A0A6G8QDC1_9ACTN|nr:CbtA family protein [Rubrobacter tropicus]QIN84495.1 hypothetical protein GBA63_18990 [Rubrobacter tropicus]